MDSLEEFLSNSMSAELDVPWFVAIASEPLMRLREAYPSVNVSALPPLANPITFQTEDLRKRSLCYAGGGSGGGSSNTNGVLIGAVVGAVLGTLLLAGLLFFLWRRRQRRKAAVPAMINSANNLPPNKLESNNTTPGFGMPPPPVPFNLTPGNEHHPSPMKQVDSSYFGSNVTTAVFPTANVGGDGSVYGQSSTSEQASYYNYAPPPPTTQPSFGLHPTTNTHLNPNPTTNPVVPSGIAYYGPNNAVPAPVTPPPPSVATPPPPSTTPGALSSYSGTSSYAPWAIPVSSEGSGSSVAGPSTPQPHSMHSGYLTAQEEKAQYSGYHGHPVAAPATPPPSKATASAHQPTSPSEGRYGVGSPPPEPAPPAYYAHTPAPR